MINLSASSIATYKACPMRYYYQYILGLVPIEDTDSQRMGTNWHRIQEIANMEPGGVCECIEGDGVKLANPNCPLCSGTGKFPDDPMDAVIAHLNQTYATPPISKTIEEWEAEKITLLYSLVGYQWYYQDTEYETEQLEQKFEIPIRASCFLFAVILTLSPTLNFISPIILYLLTVKYHHILFSGDINSYLTG